MRLRVKQARPTDLNDAIRHAVELDAFNMAERRQAEDQGYLRQASINDDTIAKLLKAIHDLQKDVKAIKLETGKPTSSEQNRPEIVCTYCKKKGHIRRHCFAYKRKLEAKKSGKEFSRDEKQKQTNKGKNRNGVSRRAGEAGIFVDAVINGSKVKLLIDTGATVSIISPDILHSVIDDPRPMLTEVKQEVLTADGSAMKVEGSISISFMMSNIKLSQLFTVIDVGIDGILGLDFLTSNSCMLDLPNSTIVLRRKRVIFSCEGKIGHHRVTFADNVSNLKCNERLTKSNIVAPVYQNKPQMDIIGPSSHLFKSDSCWAPKAQQRDSKVTQISADLQSVGTGGEYTECTLACTSKNVYVSQL
jgi:hypothetical protein